MKIKNNFFDRKVRREFWEKIGKFELLMSLLLFFPEIDDNCKNIAAIIIYTILISTYLWVWIKSNLKNEIKIKINGTEIEIRYGNIFKENGKKIITFNEYFDTIVDNEIINEESINGQFIKQYAGVSKEELDRIIEEKLANMNYLNEEKRNIGKTKKYKLGTTIRYKNDYLLTAFTKFNSENNAEVTVSEYITCLLDLWKETEKLYSQQIIVSPLLGNGTTRIKYKKFTPQEYLEILLLTFKISNIKLSLPSKLCIILDEKIKNDINLYKIEEEYKNGI